MNGYAHQIHRGDWFGGKLVGLALVEYHGIKINVYVAHVNNTNHFTCEIYSLPITYILASCKLFDWCRRRLSSSSPLCSAFRVESIYSTDKQQCWCISSIRRFKYVRHWKWLQVPQAHYEFGRYLLGKTSKTEYCFINYSQYLTLTSIHRLTS